MSISRKTADPSECGYLKNFGNGDPDPALGGEAHHSTMMISAASSRQTMANALMIISPRRTRLSTRRSFVVTRVTLVEAFKRQARVALGLLVARLLDFLDSPEQHLNGALGA